MINAQVNNTVPLMSLKQSYTYTDTPIGKLMLVAGLYNAAWYLNAIYLPNCFPVGDHAWEHDPEHNFLGNVATQLQEYFAGERRKFDCACKVIAGEFQTKALKLVAKIPYGKTKSYGELATQLGNPLASRAVGLANARNPLPIVIPCHRVIGKDGKLTGYAGGLSVKKFLLALENKGV